MNKRGVSCRSFLQVLIGVLVAAVIAISLPIQAKAKSVTMYVIASTKTKMSSGYSEAAKYTYKSTGLLAKRTYGKKTLDKFTYVGKRMKTHWKDGGEGTPSNYKYTYKSGKLVKSYDSVNRSTIKFALNKSRKVRKIRNRSQGGSTSYTTSYSYDSKGRLSSYKYGTWSNTTARYSYDSKGNIAKATEFWNDNPYDMHVTTYKNTYKNGRLVKVVKTDANGTKTTVTITYKKVKVPASYKTVVKKQQASAIKYYVDGLWWLFNLPLGSY